MSLLLRIVASSIGIAALTYSVSGTALAARAAAADEQAVIARLQAVLDGFGKRDRVEIAAQLLPGGTATLMRDGQPLQLTFDAFVDRLTAPGPDTHEERIRDPLVRIDGNIAVIWTRFALMVNGRLAKCGTDVVSLVKVDGRWLISSIGDTSRTDCKVEFGR
jgi:hypothetical protein